jgi:hypothetical protein
MTRDAKIHGFSKTRRSHLSEVSRRRSGRGVDVDFTGVASAKEAMQGGRRSEMPIVNLPIGGRAKETKVFSWKTMLELSHGKEKAIGLLDDFQKNIPKGNELSDMEAVAAKWRELLRNRDVKHYLVKLDSSELGLLLDKLPIGCAKILAEVEPRMQKQMMGRWIELEGHSLWEKIWNGVLRLLGKTTEVSGYIPTRVDRVLNAPEAERKSSLNTLARWSMLAYYEGKLMPLAVFGGEHPKAHVREIGLLEKVTEKLGVSAMLDIFGLEILTDVSVGHRNREMHEKLKAEVVRCAKKFEGVESVKGGRNISIEVVERVLRLRGEITNGNYDLQFLDDLIHVANAGLLKHEVFSGVVGELSIDLEGAVEFLNRKKDLFELERLKSFDELLLKGPELLMKNDSTIAKEYVLKRIELALRQGLVGASNRRSVTILARMCGGLEAGARRDVVKSLLERVEKRIEVQHEFEEWRSGVKTVSMFERGKSWLGKMVGWTNVEAGAADIGVMEKSEPVKAVTGSEGGGVQSVKASQEFWSMMELPNAEKGRSEFLQMQVESALIYLQLKYLNAHKTVRELRGKNLDDFEKMQLDLAEVFIKETQERLRDRVENKGWKETEAAERLLQVPEDLDGVMERLRLGYERILIELTKFEGEQEYESAMQREAVNDFLSIVEKGAAYGMYLHNATKAVGVIMQNGYVPKTPLPLLNGVGAVASTRELLAEWKKWKASGVLHENLQKVIDGNEGFDADLVAISQMVNVAQAQRGGAVRTVTSGLSVASYASTVAVLLNPLDLTIGAVGMDPLSMLMWGSTISAVAVGGGLSLYKYYKNSQTQAQIVTVRALSERLKILSGQLSVTEREKEKVRAQLVEYYAGDEDFVETLESDPLLILAVQEKLEQFLLRHDSDYAIDEILGWINPELMNVNEDLSEEEVAKRQEKIEDWLKALGVFNPVVVQAIMAVGLANKSDVKDLLRSALNLD